MAEKESDLLTTPVTYMCKWKEHSHTVRPTKITIIDGNPVRRPGIQIKFNDGFYTTRNREIVEALEFQLEHTGLKKIIQRAPTSEEINRAKKVAAEIEDAKKKIIEKHGSDKAQSPSSFREFLESKKSASSLVSGMRGVSTSSASQST